MSAILAGNYEQKYHITYIMSIFVDTKALLQSKRHVAVPEAVIG
jgi:hypothetical protein